MNKFTKIIASFVLGTSFFLSTTSGAFAATYTVKSGDTLYSIAKKYNTTYQEIMELNGLTSTLIKVGQKLEVNGTDNLTENPNLKAVELAKKYIGVPYVFGGSSPSGFDCSGFIYYVYKNAGKSISRETAADYYQKATKVTSPKVGDLVFFSNTYKKGISHVGIYIGDGQMINASSSGVKIESIKTGYWKNRLSGYGRI
ncbi:LysM peptidoglycan-binding domain-containing C40 family peptidase [Ureibacillus thermophilus]|uniref:Peptidoglycan endopeptidase n=1 Tax=Ureibacillus thermophilus TaxID=367743 RepID=A0A4V1A381_9BACL|nr:LysM peptidoglycan-binding domain-containing C40 family peptidase [Ureibacillus thermophilus]QBK26330.1 peptidoglycan endopeptidase [Ureibacillus thermophilus]